MSHIQIERVGDGILVTLPEGAYIHFTSIATAVEVATGILQVATYGADQLDRLDIEGLDALDERDA